MKVLILGDIHGRDCWKTIIRNEEPNKVIFLGDYWDSFDVPFLTQKQNFEDIINYKVREMGSNNVILLYGNHEYHYSDIALQMGEKYGGFQSGAAILINQLLNENNHLFKLAYKMDNFLFSHAGISPSFLKGVAIENNEEMVSELNDYLCYRPSVLKVKRSGETVDSSPIWIRPKFLLRDKAKELGYIQVVGHTVQNQVDIKGKSTGGKYWFMDTLGTSGEYMVIDNGKIIIKKFG